MERLMYDVYIAEAMIDNDYASFNTPEKKEALINEVFKKHKVTQAQWDTSLSWYSDKVEIYLKMNDSVRARLKRKQLEIDELLNRENSMIQSVADRSLLTAYIPEHYTFNSTNPKNGFRFRLDSTQISEQISDSVFQFSFDAVTVPHLMHPALISTLMLEYMDTTVVKSDTIVRDSTYVIEAKKYLIEDTLRSIIGFVRLQDPLGIYRGIQLSNIFLGSLTADSIEQAPIDSLNNPLELSSEIQKDTLAEAESQDIKSQRTELQKVEMIE